MSQSDEELTSLSWLHDRNVLKDITDIQFLPGGKESLKVEKSSYFPRKNITNPFYSKIASSVKYFRTSPFLPAYNPEVDTSCKPPFSFSMMIFMAIEDTVEKALSVRGIYDWIKEHFPYYRNASVDWKNSVRHNLSVNRYFRRLVCSPDSRKSSLSVWAVEPVYRPILVDALNRSPFKMCSQIWNATKQKNRESCGYTGSSNATNVQQDLFPRLSQRLASIPNCSVKCPRQQQQQQQQPESHRYDESQPESLVLLPCKEEWYHQLRGDRNGVVPSFDELSPTSKKENNIPKKDTYRSFQHLLVISSPSEEHTYCSRLKQEHEELEGARALISLFESKEPIVKTEIEANMEIPEYCSVETVQSAMVR